MVIILKFKYLNIYYIISFLNVENQILMALLNSALGDF